MNNKTKEKIFDSVKVVSLAILLFFGLSYAMAWQDPTANPPDGSVIAPIHEGSTGQTKSGGLGVLGNFSVGGDSLLNGRLSLKGWMSVNNKATGGFAGGDNRAAITFGASDQSNSWYLGQVADSSEADNTLGLYDWSPGGGWVMAFKKGGNVGIGTENPVAKLDVNGSVKISGGNPGVGKVLTSDGNGLASWQGSSPAPSTIHRFYKQLGSNCNGDDEKAWDVLNGNTILGSSYYTTSGSYCHSSIITTDNTYNYCYMNYVRLISAGTCEIIRETDGKWKLEVALDGSGVGYSVSCSMMCIK